VQQNETAEEYLLPIRHECLQLIAKYPLDPVLKTFVVLLSCCLIDEQIGEFIEMRQAFDYSTMQEAIASPNFDTGDKQLTQQVKQYSHNIVALLAALKE
jgi:hypothetical protein